MFGSLDLPEAVEPPDDDEPDSPINWNHYKSSRDRVLATLYKSAEIGQPAVGAEGFKSTFAKSKDRDVSRVVGTHSGYFEGVMLAKS